MNEILIGCLLILSYSAIGCSEVDHAHEGVLLEEVLFEEMITKPVIENKTSSIPEAVSLSLPVTEIAKKTVVADKESISNVNVESYSAPIVTIEKENEIYQ